MFSLTIEAILTIAVFCLFRRFYSQFSLAIFNPVLLTILTLCLALAIFNTSYYHYYQATIGISFFLELAVVALAYPLYTQFHDFKAHALLLVTCSFIGVSISTLCAFVLCLKFDGTTELSASLAGLSVTTPISIIVTQTLGGIPSVAAIMVILIGVFGGTFGLALLSLFSIDNVQAKGIALGVSCHAIGTAAALEYHPKAGAFASAAMIISALITAFWVPILYTWLVEITST